MKKLVYQPLTDFLTWQSDSVISISFSKIEEILGRKLPPTAYGNDTWWTNNPTGHSQAKAWLAAGFRAEPVDVDRKMVMFKRPAQSQRSSGMSDEAREFKPAEDANEKKQNRHPALGAMKGTFTIEPGYDLTSAVYTDEEWAEIEKEMSADWDQIEQGMSGGNK